jgi:hypothetical protein
MRYLSRDAVMVTGAPIWPAFSRSHEWPLRLADLLENARRVRGNALVLEPETERSGLLTASAACENEAPRLRRSTTSLDGTGVGKGESKRADCDDNALLSTSSASQQPSEAWLLARAELEYIAICTTFSALQARHASVFEIIDAPPIFGRGRYTAPPCVVSRADLTGCVTSWTMSCRMT